MLAYATTNIARLSPLVLVILLLGRSVLDFIVAAWALSRCDKANIAETIRALAEYRHGK